MSFSKEKSLCWAGICCVAASLLCNEWSAAFLLSEDGQIDAAAKIVVLMFQAMALLSGLLLIRFRSKIYFNLLQPDYKILEGVLVVGLLLRVAVFIALEPHNNDPHIDYIDYIAQNGELPTADKLLLSFHPPLYYVMATPISKVGSDKAVQFLSLLFSLVNLALLYHLFRTTKLIKSYAARCHGFLLAALLPQFIIFGNFISNDSLSFVIGTLIFMLAFQYVEQPRLNKLALLSFAVGLGLLTKGGFLGWFAAVFALIILVGLEYKFQAKGYLMAILIFLVLGVGVGSYKYVENTKEFGKPFLDNSILKQTWVQRQQPTITGLGSLIDINISKLVRYPYLSDYTRQSAPLLFYGTFWNSYIRESNFVKSRDYPFVYLPRLIYILAIPATLLMLIGAIKMLVNSRRLVDLLRKDRASLKEGLRESILLLFFFSNFILVLIWGVKHDAWSFFQSRLLFISLFAIAAFLAHGYETVILYNRNLTAFLNVSLGLLAVSSFSLLGIEIVGQFYSF